MSGQKVDVRGILERAGANPDAPEGSQAWALAQVDAALAELRDAIQAYLLELNAPISGDGKYPAAKRRLRDAMNSIGGDA